MKKNFFPHVDGRFRAYSKLTLDDSIEFGIQWKIKIFKFSKWITIFKRKDIEVPTVKVGCINYHFNKVVELLNSL